jgi:uncharacterized protein (DUF427 family)
MAKAIWQGQVIAESNDFEVVEGNVYFPPGTIGKRNENAAWFYPETKDAAANIKDHIAFWKGVTVER